MEVDSYHSYLCQENNCFSIMFCSKKYWKGLFIHLMFFFGQTEVNFLGQLRHPNLVKLIGYCCEDDHRLLVYEFMFRGSLENHLFRSNPSTPVCQIVNDIITEFLSCHCLHTVFCFLECHPLITTHWTDKKNINDVTFLIFVTAVGTI